MRLVITVVNTEAWDSEIFLKYFYEEHKTRIASFFTNLYAGRESGSKFLGRISIDKEDMKDRRAQGDVPVCKTHPEWLAYSVVSNINPWIHVCLTGYTLPKAAEIKKISCRNEGMEDK